MAIEFQLKGVEKAQRSLQALADRFSAEAKSALREEAEIEMTEAKRRTPVDTGDLKRSGHVEASRWSGRNLSVSLKFGGPAAPYALRVHEDLEVFHKNGQAKYLESVLLESKPYMAQRIAARIRRKVGG